MGRLVFAVTAILFMLPAASIPAGADECADPVPVDLMCRSPYTAAIPAVRHQTQPTSWYRACEIELQNCVTGLLDQEAVSSLKLTAAAGLRLGRSDAEAVVASANAWSLEEVSLAHNPHLGRIASYLVYGQTLDSARDYLRWYASQDLEAALGLAEPADLSLPNQSPMAPGKGATLREILDHAIRVRQGKDWLRISEAVGRCQDLRDRHELTPDEFTENFLCAMQLATGTERFALARRWPGCRCEGGVLLNGVCMAHDRVSAPKSDARERSFIDQPIETRMLDALSEFTERVNGNAALRGARISRVGIRGCGLPRFERGSNVRGLKNGDILGFHHISSHSRAASCDIRFFDFRGPDGREIRVDLGENGVYPFKADLERYAARKRIRMPFAWQADAGGRRIKVQSRDVGEFYREVEAALARERSPRWEKLRLGVAARNALADAGLIVLGPTVNSAHTDHFHVEASADPGVWAALVSDETTLERRESLVRASIRAAAGAR